VNTRARTIKLSWPFPEDYLQQKMHKTIKKECVSAAATARAASETRWRTKVVVCSGDSRNKKVGGHCGAKEKVGGET